MEKLRKLCRVAPTLRHFHTSRKLLHSSLYEPPYLESMKPKVPIYDALNIQLRGNDYPILENYQKFVHTLATNLEINVEEAWASPAQEMQVTTLKPKSEIPNAVYNLKIYERTVQITDVLTSQDPCNPTSSSVYGDQRRYCGTGWDKSLKKEGDYVAFCLIGETSMVFWSLPFHSPVPIDWRGCSDIGLVSELPILLRALEASCPSGVTVHVVPHEEWHEEIRYVPDNELKALKQTLDEMGGPSKKK